MITRQDSSTFVMDNGFISRTMTVDKRGLHTSSLINRQNNFEYVYAIGGEFGFSADDKYLSSFSETVTRELDGVTVEELCNFVFTDYETEKNADNSETLILNFTHESKLKVAVSYKMFPQIAGVRKHLEITNISDKDVVITNLNIDNILFSPGDPGDCRNYLDFDRSMPMCFATESYEENIRIHNHDSGNGYFFGSNIPGVMRNFLYYPQWGSVCCSYNKGGAYFRKTLAPQEKLVTHDSLFAVYNGKFEDPSCAEPYRKLVRANLPELPAQEGIMYCTWIPFLHNISEELVNRLTDNASEMGFDYLVIDDGWFKVKSDWQVDETKFPNGLEVVSEKVRKAGLKFGLWFNIGTDYGAKECDDALTAKTADGNIKYFSTVRDRKVMCFGSDYRFKITEKLIELAERYHVSYFKLDFTTLSSPYNTLEWGCHDCSHRFHRNYNDSILAMYEGMKYLRDELKKRFPELIVDFSFETFGIARPSAAALEYSEIHHISNLSANKQKFQKIDGIRQSFYQWLTVMPPERILNGLLSIQGEKGTEYFLTALAGAPLVAGDLNALSPEVKQRIFTCGQAFKKITEGGPLTAFEIVCNTLERDGFIRKADDGRAICCLFNRTNEVWKLDLPGFINAENNSEIVEVAPNDCAMYIKSIC